MNLEDNKHIRLLLLSWPGTSVNLEDNKHIPTLVLVDMELPFSCFYLVPDDNLCSPALLHEEGGQGCWKYPHVLVHYEPSPGHVQS